MNIKEEFSRFQKWLRTHKDDYTEILREKPYCIETKFGKSGNEDLVLFKYSQIDSDFSEPFVKLCRGLVLDSKTFESVVFPFVKFHNYGEVYADDIDWNTAAITQKIDGSITKIVKTGDKTVLIGTNSNIDAVNAPLAEQIGCPYKTFKDLILVGLAYYGLDEEKLAGMLDYGKTYVFEMVSPYSTVVVRYPETKLYLIGIRDNATLEEEKFEESPLAKIFKIPKIYHMKSIDECIAAARELPDDEEGYVVRDDYFHRIKVKSPKYLYLHSLAGNHVMSYERAVDIVQKNEIDEITSYFPDFKNVLDEVKMKYDALGRRLETRWNEFAAILPKLATRKEQALWIVKNFEIPGIGFALLDKKTESVAAWLQACPAKNLVEMLKLKKLN